MIVYKIEFKDRCNGVNKNQLKGTPLYNLFRDYSGQIIDMRRLVATAQAYGFVVNEIVHNNYDSVYNVVSGNAPFSINMSISKKPEYIEKNEQIYKPTIEILNSMSKNANVVHNNITNINQFQEQPNLQVIETTKCKGVKYWPSIKKLFKERPKLAIALCTLTAATTIAAGGFIVKTAADRIETQKYLDNVKYEQQTTAPETTEPYNINNFIDETRKSTEMNNGIASEQQLQYVQEQNYQRTR